MLAAKPRRPALRKERKMYKAPTIMFTFCVSTFEQYQPSTAGMAMDFEHGTEDNLKVLSDYDKLRFLQKCFDMLSEEIIDRRVRAKINEAARAASTTHNNARAEILQALARGYCSVRNEHKVLDSDLIEAMADELAKLSPVA
jgi:hypothetical protein